MNLEWNVFYYDFNAKEIKVSNVFNHGRYKTDVENLLHKCKDIEEFSDKLRSATMYYFWSKCEWETIIYPWVGDEKAAYNLGKEQILSLLNQSLNEFFSEEDGVTTPAYIVHVPGLNIATDFASIDEIQERFGEQK